MKIKVSEATNNQLNWMVAKCIYPHGSDEWLSCISAQEHYCTDWSQGGPIIERERIATAYEPSLIYDDSCRWKALAPMSDNEHQYGPTPLIAAMRCVVMSELGDEVEVPEELT